MAKITIKELESLTANDAGCSGLMKPWHRMDGETRTIAVFRAVVWAKFGITVSVPAEHIQL